MPGLIRRSGSLDWLKSGWHYEKVRELLARRLPATVSGAPLTEVEQMWLEERDLLSEHGQRDGLGGRRERQRLIGQANHTARADGQLQFFQSLKMPDIGLSRRSGFLELQRIDNAILNDEKIDFLYRAILLHDRR